MPTSEYPPPGYYLRIKNWDEHFERAQTRKVPSPLSWIALPTKHDGCKFRKLIRTKRGVTIFGTFCLMIEVGAKMAIRGDFVRHDGSILTCLDFEAITGADRRTFKAAIEVLLSPEVGWLELVACSQAAPGPIPRRSDMREEEKRREREKNGSPSPEGWSGHPAVQLYRERFHPERVLPILVQEQIEQAIGSDLSGWNAVLEYWQLNDHKPQSIGRMLDRYREQANGAGDDDNVPWKDAI